MRGSRDAGLDVPSILSQIPGFEMVNLIQRTKEVQEARQDAIFDPTMVGQRPLIFHIIHRFLGNRSDLSQHSLAEVAEALEDGDLP